MKWLFGLGLLIVGPLVVSAQIPVKVLETEWKRVDRIVPNVPPPQLVWWGEPLIHPRGIMLDPDTNILYGPPGARNRKFTVRPFGGDIAR